MKIGLVFLSLSPVFVTLMVAGINLQEARVLKNFTEDALTASNLASAVIDLDRYGNDNEIIIADPDAAYQLYREALKVNMKLNDSFEREDECAIAGTVEVLDYVIYNVSGNDVEVYSYGQNPYYMLMENGLGSVTAPNGEIVESTSVYSRITFPVESAFNINVTAVKDELVDIVG